MPASKSNPRIADRLAAARRTRFVGREAELDLFRSALLAPEPPFAVLHVYGPGGIGKTTLVQECARIGRDNGRPVVRLDVRHLEPAPAVLLANLGHALGLAPGDTSALAQWPANGILIIDTYESFVSLDGWLREEFLPQLPAQTLVVIAGRLPPAAAWSTDIDWAPLTRILALRNLRPEESQTYLTVRGVPPAR
ncbi:MAG: AAA family ATPase, partial [Sulfurifustaceae bacterium]